MSEFSYLGFNFKYFKGDCFQRLSSFFLFVGFVAVSRL